VSKLTPKPIWTLRLSESRRVSLPDCVVISDEIANQISWRKRLFVSVAPNRTLAIIYIFENFRRAPVKSSMVSRGARELLGIPHSLQVSCVCGHLFVMKDVGVLRMLSPTELWPSYIFLKIFAEHLSIHRCFPGVHLSSLVFLISCRFHACVFTCSL
jgi:hypothetical protein